MNAQDELKANGYGDDGVKRRSKMWTEAWFHADGEWAVTIITGSLCGQGGLTITANGKRLATTERRALAKLQRALRREAGKLLAMADRLGGTR